MKNFIRLTAAMTCAILFLALISKPLSAQTTQEQAKVPPASLPSDVSKVLMASCAKCHMEPGNQMALTHVNLSKWDGLTPEKQVSKASAMSNMISKGKMPPKGFKKDFPDKVPTEADVKVIADWAKTLQPKK